MVTLSTRLKFITREYAGTARRAETDYLSYKNKNIMKKKFICTVCGYIYNEAVGDPEHGIAPGTRFEDLPADYECPLCGVGTDLFEEE